MIFSVVTIFLSMVMYSYQSNLVFIPCVSIYHALAPSLVDSDLLLKLDRLAAQVDMLAYAAKFGLKIYQRYN